MNKKLAEKASVQSDLIKERLTPPSHWDWHGKTPFAQGWRVGPLIFVGGQLSAGPDGAVVGKGDIETQTRNVFQNIARVLAEANADWSNVIKLNTYYVYNGPEDKAQEFWEKMTRVRMEFIRDPGPAATAVRVVGLMYPDFLIEAEAIALVGGAQA